MEVEKTFFNIEWRKDIRGNRYYALIMTPEVSDLMGDPICCQKCQGMIKGKFYICEEYRKWFCVDCQLKVPAEINVKDLEEYALCNFDHKTTGRQGEEHAHICIKGVDGLDDS